MWLQRESQQGLWGREAPKVFFFFEVGEVTTLLNVRNQWLLFQNQVKRESGFLGGAQLLW